MSLGSDWWRRAACSGRWEPGDGDGGKQGAVAAVNPRGLAQTDLGRARQTGGVVGLCKQLVLLQAACDEYHALRKRRPATAHDELG